MLRASWKAFRSLKKYIYRFAEVKCISTLHGLRITILIRNNVRSQEYGKVFLFLVLLEMTARVQQMLYLQGARKLNNQTIQLARSYQPGSLRSYIVHDVY